MAIARDHCVNPNFSEPKAAPRDSPPLSRAHPSCVPHRARCPRRAPHLANNLRAILQPPQRILQFAIAHGRGAHHQPAIGHCLRHALEFLSLRQRWRSPAADRASRYAFSYGVTTRKCANPKLLIARAAAPIFKGLRVETSTTRRWSTSRPALMSAYSTAPAQNMNEQQIAQADRQEAFVAAHFSAPSALGRPHQICKVGLKTSSQTRRSQMTTDSRYSPNTRRSASEISPTVA